MKFLQPCLLTNLDVKDIKSRVMQCLRSDVDFLNASKYCGSVLKNDFVVVVADKLLSNFQRI